VAIASLLQLPTVGLVRDFTGSSFLVCVDFSFGVDAVVSRMQPLFQGHPNLIRDFNAFLPRGYVLRDNQQCL